MYVIRFMVALALICSNSLFAGGPSDDATPIDSKKAQSKYVIEPPDVLSITLSRPVPRAYRVAVFDIVKIHVARSLPDARLNDNYMIEDDGTVNLGSPYGSVRLAGMAIDEIAQAINKHLEKSIRKPDAAVQLVKASWVRPVTGQYLVGPDGTINLRQYGVVHIAGRTVSEARAAIQGHLMQFLNSPESSLDVVAYNSKTYYVITRQAGEDDSVRRLSFTGSETVLDAISQVDGLSQAYGKEIWIARQVPGKVGREQILSVDWDAITQGAETATNYQLLPGDRLFIVTEKVTAPASIERVPGIMNTSNSTNPSFQTMGRNYNRTRSGL
ncbi:MAG: polysaccharide biosynthesis/export family protein [Thermoguttaceae bacterium]|jgi:polysaccharide export outer membrane protein